MEFRILGPLEVHADGGVVELPGPKPRAVLAMLLLSANQPVSPERLALALWGEEAADGAAKTVQVHVSGLRKALGNHAQITRTDGGYRLDVGPGELDSDRFEALAVRARRALADEDADHAAELARQALAMWRG